MKVVRSLVGGTEPGRSGEGHSALGHLSAREPAALLGDSAGAHERLIWGGNRA